MQLIDPILNPTIFLGSFEWREPMTTSTDLMVALVSFYGFYRFSTYKGEKADYFVFFKYYFLCFGVGMICAAWLGHGLQAYVGPEYKRIGWAFSSTGLLLFAFASLKQIKQYISPFWKTFFQVLIIVQYIVFMVLMLHPALSDFKYAQLSSTVSLGGIAFPMQIFNYVKTKNKGSLIIVLSVIYGLIPGYVFNNQVSFHRWFNYHDFSHVLMALFMLLLYLGASRLSLQPSVSKS